MSHSVDSIYNNGYIHKGSEHWKYVVMNLHYQLQFWEEKAIVIKKLKIIFVVLDVLTVQVVV